MPDKKPAHQAAATEEQQGCPVNMWANPEDQQPCGRPVHKAPEGVDKVPVCLMHSRDPDKDNAAFQAEFERILQAAGEENADFTGFVFPRSNYRGRQFKARCAFKESAFNREADFSYATFTQHVDFWSSTFTQGANFEGATFTQRAYFEGATFSQDADFSHVMFTQDADFVKATFTHEADFVEATFAWDANFFKATFNQEPGFYAATFTQNADFSEAVFTRRAEFDGARFRGEVQFREALFRRDDTREPGLVFSLARLEKPEAVTFYKTYLGQALFHNCDVSRFAFSDVEWRKRANGKSMVFEEELGLKPSHPVFDQNDYSKALRPTEQDSDGRNYGLIAELYQQLKKNYDDRGDYWTAGDFHYGEMEMKRLHSPSHRRWAR